MSWCNTLFEWFKPSQVHFPVNIHLGSFSVSLHAVTELLAFIIGYRIYAYRKKRIEDPFTSEQRLYILLGAAIGALFFSRIIAGLEHPSLLAKTTNIWLYFYLNKTVVGGFLGGWLGVEITKYLLKTKRSSGDVMVVPIAIALIIGRIGCFSQGVFEETYGNETTWWTGMDLGDGKLRHPLALYEMVWILFLVAGVYWLERKKSLAEGLRFKLFMFGYFAYRFVAEYYKPHEPLALQLNSIQWGILICYLLYAPFFIQFFLHPKKTLYAN